MDALSRFDDRHDGPAGPNASAGQRLRVLIVDDDADTADTMAILLGHWGFEATAVRTGAEALQMMKALRPDVILLDIGMPGMNGFELARRLRETVPARGKAPFLIAVSGYGDAQTCQRSQEAGINLHLIKPVEPAYLEELLRRFQSIVVPAAECRTSERYRHPRLIPTLRHWSQRTMLRQSLVRANAIVQSGTEIVSTLRTTRDKQEWSRLRSAWCERSAQFLDEVERIQRLLVSFQRWGTGTTTDV
ncbi:MAG TPA: response regulator [Gemmataceae bacterium]|nr:response regulator [Gemmataceae bacterium]